MKSLKKINFKKVFLLLIIILLCVSCKKFISSCLNLSIKNKITNITQNSYMKSLYNNSYRMDILVTYYANDMESKYRIIDDVNGEYEKLTYLEPEKFNGMTVEVNGNELIHMNPYIQKNITYYTDSTKDYNNILFSSFVKNYLNDKNSSFQETKNDYILYCTIPGDNYYFKYQECYISKETKEPLRLVIKSKDKVKICDVLILEIKNYNKNLDQDENTNENKFESEKEKNKKENEESSKSEEAISTSSKTLLSEKLLKYFQIE